MFSWFSTSESARFGQELARSLMSELSGSTGKNDVKFIAKTEKALSRADRQVQEFKARERMNFLKKAKLANAFLWTLRDAGCSPEYANQLTEWLSVRL